MAKKGLTRLIPVVGKAFLAKDAISKSSHLTKASNTAHDLTRTPSRLSAFCYFEPEVSFIRPTAIRIDHDKKKNQVVKIWGHGLETYNQLFARVRFYHGDDFFYETKFSTARHNGSLAEIVLPYLVIANLKNPIRAELAYGEKIVPIPGQIRIIGSILLKDVEPSNAYPGQVVRISGEGIYPYRLTNRVLLYKSGGNPRFGRELEIKRMNHTAIHVLIPNSLAGTEVRDWSLHVEEEYGSGKKKVQRRSNTVQIKLNAGKYEDYQEEVRQELMKGWTRQITGVLTKEKNVNRIPIDVTAGMSLDVTLEGLRGKIAEMKLFMESKNEQGKRVVKGGQFSLHSFHVVPKDIGTKKVRMTHTTSGKNGKNRYWLYVRKWGGDSCNYSIRVKAIPRDDGGTGLDAPDRLGSAMNLPLDKLTVGHLFGHPEQVGEDFNDCWRIQDIAAGEKIVFVLSETEDVKNWPDGRDESLLYSIELYREIPGPNGIPAYELVERKRGINREKLPLRLEHVEEADRNYVVRIRHHVGCVRYRIKAMAIYQQGPIKSDDAEKR